jgi:hypothetical protein
MRKIYVGYIMPYLPFRPGHATGQAREKVSVWYRFFRVFGKRF